VDDVYPAKHQRHIVLQAHCFRLANGKVGGANGLVDPKELLVGNILYIRLAYAAPRCALCEDDGDMIPIELRFFGSPYAPPTEPLGAAILAWLRIKKSYYVLHDRWAQRNFVRKTMPE
jgi:hypothetical protein